MSRLSARVLIFFAAIIVRGAAWAQQAPEFRALWADTFHAGMRNSSEVSALVNTARGSNFNAIIVEVRKRCDAYYNSTIEPKASDVSPQSFDPLSDLIAKAHNGGRRIEVHPWITTYLVWNNQSSPPPQTNHPFNLHPEWLSVDNSGNNWDGSNYQFDQGLPEVQAHTYAVAMDIISRYDVDGFHFDYIRYSGRNWGYHSNTVARFNRRFNRAGVPTTTDAQWLQFRRDQVSDLVRKVYLNAIALKPQIKISAATICFAPGITDDTGWFNSSAAWNTVLQDWRGWMREGILDLNVPMMYFDQRRYSTDWAAWSVFAKEHAYSRHVAIGQGSYLNTLSNMIYQLRTTRVPSPNSNAVPAGLAMYSYAVPVTNDTAPATAFRALTLPSAYDPNPVPLFTNPVAPPVMLWKTAPTVGYLKGTIRSAIAVSNRELDGAFVSINGPVLVARTNDATGFYGFANLPPGTYTVTASYSNFASMSASVLISTGSVATLDFALSPFNSVLSNVRAYPGQTEAIVAWTTGLPSDSQVAFGLTPAFGDSTWKWSWLDPAPVTNHAVLVTDLLPNTNYFFSARSRDGTNTWLSSVAMFSTAGEIILDNTSAALAGSWSTGTSSLDKYGSDYVFATVGGATATATYTPNITTPGDYDVYVWYPEGANRSTNAPFLLAFSGGMVNGSINQTTGGGSWRLVVTNKFFARGTDSYFQWQDQAPDSGKVVMADAVRFVYAAGQEPAADTVPRWWSEFYFGGIVDASLDSDGDGFSIAKEYVAGTDPTRSASRLRFGIEDRTGNVLRLSFAPFHSGRTYELESETTLSTNGWNTVSGAPQILPDSDGVFSVTNFPGTEKYYRLRVRLSH